jgi:hypothetical protein
MVERKLKLQSVGVGFLVKAREPELRFKPETANITAKKTVKPLKFPNRPITMVSSFQIPGTADIAIKKKIKYLTFDFHCVRKEWIMKMNNITGNGDIDVFS